MQCARFVEAGGGGLCGMSGIVVLGAEGLHMTSSCPAAPTLSRRCHHLALLLQHRLDSELSRDAISIMSRLDRKLWLVHSQVAIPRLSKHDAWLVLSVSLLSAHVKVPRIERNREPLEIALGLSQQVTNTHQPPVLKFRNFIRLNYSRQPHCG